MIQEVKERVKALLTDVICQVCTKEVPHKSQIQIEGTLCITSDSHPTFAIQIAQLLSKAEPLTIQNLSSKPLYSGTPSSLPYGNNSQTLLPPGGAASYQQPAAQGSGSGPQSGTQSAAVFSSSSQQSLVNNPTTGYYQEQSLSRAVAPPISLARTNDDKISPVNQMPPIVEIPRRLTQPGETKHYIHPIKRRRLSSEPSLLEMRPPPEPPRRRESDSSMSSRCYQTPVPSEHSSSEHSSSEHDPEQIYQNVQRNARIVIKKVNMSDETHPEHSSGSTQEHSSRSAPDHSSRSAMEHSRSAPLEQSRSTLEHSRSASLEQSRSVMLERSRSPPTDIQNMQTLKSKLIGQPMVLRVDDHHRHDDRNLLPDDLQQYRNPLERRHSDVVLPNDLHHEHREILERLHRHDNRNQKRLSESSDQSTSQQSTSQQSTGQQSTGQQSSGQNVKDKVRSFLYKREKSVERLVDHSPPPPPSRGHGGGAILCHSASAPSLSALASAASTATPAPVPHDVVVTATIDQNHPTDLSRKGSLGGGVGGSGSSSVIREMLQSFCSPTAGGSGSRDAVYGLMTSAENKSELVAPPVGVKCEQGVRQALHDLMTSSTPAENNIHKVLELERNIHNSSAILSPEGVNNSLVGMVTTTSSYDSARYYDDQQSESINKLNALSRLPATAYPKYYLTTVGSLPVSIVPTSRGLTTITEAQGLEPVDQSIPVDGSGDHSNDNTTARLTTLAPLRPATAAQLQQLTPLTPNDAVRSLYGTTYRLTPLSPAATAQQSQQYTIFQRSESVKSSDSSSESKTLDSGVKSEPDSGLVCGSSGRVKELDLGQMTKETINGLIIVDEESHKTISPQDYIYKDESTGETQVRACEYCGKHFKYFSKLMEHIRSHTKQKPYKCSICGRTYTYKGDLTVHIRQHSSSKPFVCECGRAFASKKYLSVHQSQARIKGRHAIPKEGELRSDVSYDCKLCDKRFRFQSSFDLHLQLHQTSDEDIKQETDGELYECQACNTCFRDHSLFVEHVLEHEKSKDGTPPAPSILPPGDDIDVDDQSTESSPSSLVTISTNRVVPSIVASRISLPENLQGRFPMLASIASSRLPVNITATTTDVIHSLPSTITGSNHSVTGSNQPVASGNQPVGNSCHGNVRLTASAQLRCLSELATTAQSDVTVATVQLSPSDATQYTRPMLLESGVGVQLATISGVGVQPSGESGVGVQQSSLSGADVQHSSLVSGVGVQPSSLVSGVGVQRRHELPLSLVRTSVTQTEADSTNTTGLDSPAPTHID
ncbi:uncharacterized protein LOC141906691 [Tubulanus polymorphus]|uniref:uncharacterized protein LOC141906691 n=1 Tax=Tubulanus polymorphus TaxID=672921 RepID=UPI003DA3E13F